MSNGLSPLSRGTHEQACQTMEASRFIPALAGNTTAGAVFPEQVAVYPRSHGEHKSVPMGSGVVAGLSPLSRGTLLRWKLSEQFRQFIPALAGNTPAKRRLSILIAVYPRSRGEHNKISDNNNDNSGLSPLSRGTRI